MTTTAPLPEPLADALITAPVDAPFAGTPAATSGARRPARLQALTVGTLVVLDAASVAASALLVTTWGDAPTGGRAPAYAAALGALWLTLLACCAAYASTSGRDRGHGVLRAGVVLGLLCWSVPTVVEVRATPEQLLAVTGLLSLFALASRAAVDAGWSRVSPAGTRVLVAGEPDDVARAVAELARVPGERWSVAGTWIVDPATARNVDAGDPGDPGDPGDIARAAASAGAEAVVVLPCRELGPTRLRRLGWQLETTGTRVYVGTGLLDVAPSRAALVCAGDLSLVQLRAPGGGLARWVKAAMDRAGAAVLLALLAPLLAGVAIAVRLDSRGPAIFRQVRVGRDGREFTMFKFRTMTVDADVVVDRLVDCNEFSGGVLFKIREDPRITRVGGFLRRYSIDELPQLVNVLLGQMALVGPRPALPGEVAQYDVDPRRRLAVRPGLTGLWQVSGRSDLSWEETVRLDLHYVDNWSLGTDLRILRRTLRAVLAHDGAY